MRLIMREILIMNLGGSYLILTICIHYCMMSLKLITSPQHS